MSKPDENKAEVGVAKLAQESDVNDEINNVVYKWEDIEDYMIPRMATSAVFGGLYGATTGYYVGGNVLAKTLAISGPAFMVSTTFFGTNIVLRTLRQKDDYTNYAVSGVINGWLLGGMSNRRNSLIGAVVGCLGGVVYKAVSTSLYNTSREAWISNRRYILENSKPRTLHNKKPSPTPIATSFPAESTSQPSSTQPPTAATKK